MLQPTLAQTGYKTFDSGRSTGWPHFRLAPGPGVLDLRPQTQWRHGPSCGPCRRHAAHVWRRSAGSQGSQKSTAESCLGASSLVTAHSARGGASLQAETGRSEQGDVRSRSRWPRLVPPPPLFHRTHGLRGRALGCSRQGEGCTIELDSSSLTPGVGRLYQVTTPAGREEPGTSLYPSYTDPPHAPRPRVMPRGNFRRLLHAGIAGSGRIWASQLAPQPAWAGPGRGGHCGGRGGSRDMKTGVSERLCTSCSYHQPRIPRAVHF